ncbi:ubr-1 [Pristionchus pacificus]|uniref:E3 ubiquitin-protein ligase n=1 Tax=Pristionchus pacificus TaxID=54126 RepID=A0A2A6BN62_PRIPA|nr:ubr-1 [Pristionchus pacificus]|eukprot:PDM67355.1 ubr-1 [Pristionchus pacificus]
MIDKLVRAIEDENLEVARVVFYDYAKEAPKVFKSFDQPWEYKQDESAIKSTFLVPIAMAYCGTEDVEEMKQGEETVASMFKLNEQCATDPTCVLCQECFSQSAHRNHKYRMYTSNGSGYCDCGDADAWTAHYACSTHSKENVANVPTTIPDHLLPRLRSITTVILEYAARVLAWPKDKSFLLHLPGLKRISDPKRTFQTMLYNDETHTYDSVIRALELSIHCTKEQAMMMATFVDKEGCTSVATGDKEACVRVLTDIKRRTQRDQSRRTERTGPLEVHVLESELISHQHLAIALLQWLCDQVTVFPLIGDVVGEILLRDRVRVERMETDSPLPSSSGLSPTPMQSSPEESTIDTTGINDDTWIGEAATLVEAVMGADSMMWKQARASWHQLMMKTVLMNMDQKLAFSRRFLHMYPVLQSGFIEDDQEHDVSVVALSVQMLTVPPIARRLISEESALARIFDVFLKQCEKWVCTDKDTQGAPLPVAHRRRFDFSKHTYPVTIKRALHMIRDQVYLLTQKPTAEEWNDQLRTSFLAGFDELIKLLDLMQGMDEVKRQEGEHQQWEMEWETAFNMQLRLQEMITLMVSWANSDPIVHLEVTHRVVNGMMTALDEMNPIELEAGATHGVITIGGFKHIVPIFDALRHPVSIHIPVFRLLAGLVTANLPEARRYLDPLGEPTTPKEIEVRNAIKKLDYNLFELQTRVLVLSAQMGANLWRRNGFSLVNQVHNYFSPLCRTEMYDQDLVALQYAAATIDDVNKFVIHFMFRYRISSWADPNFEGAIAAAADERKPEKEDMSKYTVLLAEHFFTTIINILSERYRPGVGECVRADMLEREIIHVLATGPQTFSYIQQKLHHDPLLHRVSVNETVTKVADFKRLTSNAAGKFELKDEYLEKYDTFFYHYTRQSSSAAEQYQKKHRANKNRAIRACPPPVPIPLEPLFLPLTRLLLAPSLISTLVLNLQRVVRRSRYQSESIFHRILYIIGIGLHEQSRRLVEFDFVGMANKDEYRVLKHLEDLTSKAEGAAHADLLWWTIQKFKEVTAARDAEIARREGTTNEMEEEEKEGEDKKVEEGVDELERKKKAKAALAAKMRANAMNQMQRLQKRFTAQVEKEEEELKHSREEGPDHAEHAEKEEKRLKEAELYDEDEDCPVLTEKLSSFPVCIGPAKLVIEKVHPRTVTCVLCQEREPLDTAHARFVCAAYVQRSQLFAQHGPSADLRLDSFLVNSTLVDEMETTTCSHTMHYDCYTNLHEANLLKERRGRQLIMTNKILDTDNGEYLCPLCKRLSNTAVPLLPPIHSIPIVGFSTNHPAGEDETFESWVTEMRRFVALTKPKHSRKRSHSERSLLDLGKVHGERGGERDPLAQGSLEGALGMDEFMGELAPAQRRGVREAVMDLNEFLALGEAREEVERDDELLLLLRGAAAAVMADARVPVDAAAAAAAANDVNNQAAVNLDLALGRPPAAAAVADGADDDGEIAMVIDDIDEEDEEDAPAAPLPARLMMNRRNERRGEIEQFGRRMQAIPGVLTGIIKGLPTTILAKLSKRVLPSAVSDSEDGVRHFTKFLMKTHITTDETRSFSSTITVWRTTTHVLRSVSAILEIEGKPLFGALNTRQRDCLTCLTRLSALLSCNLAPFGELIKVMLRILLHPSVANPYPATRPTFRSTVASTSNSSIGPSTSASGGEAGPSTSSSSAPLSPPPVYNCRPPPKEEKDVKRGRAAAAAIALFFQSEKKEITFNILNIDILALTMELMMCIGWTWHDGVRTAKNVCSQYAKELVADGSNDELHVMRLGLTAFLFQVIATHTESVDADMEVGEEGREGEDVEMRMEHIWKEIKGVELKDARGLIKKLRDSIIHFLRPLALLYHSLRLVPPPEALRDPSVDEFEPLCRYMGLPHSMLDLLSSPVLDELFAMWSPCVPSDVKDIPKQPARARQLIPLPKDFSDLITIAAKFRCPSIPLDEKSTMPTMCLLCGQLLCSQSYCCQKFVNKDNVGACMQHLPSCSGGTGMFLRIRDCYIVLLTNRLRGCIRAAPYVDEFGEVDQGFRRGNPMHLNEEMYSKLRHLWLHQNISEEVVNRYEIDHRNMAYEWNHF